MSLMGSQSTGQGHDTAYAQIVADHLGLPPERVRMVQGDTEPLRPVPAPADRARSRPAAPRVAVAAQEARGQFKGLPRMRSRPSAGDLEIADGAVRVAGTDRAITFADLAKHPRRPRTCSRRPMPSSRRSRPIRTAHTSPKSRSTRRPAILGSSIMSMVDDFGCHAQSAAARPARCMAAQCRASARR